MPSQNQDSNFNSFKQLTKKVWENCTFENTRYFFSFTTNLTAIGSTAAGLLPKPVKQVVAPILGGLSYASLQAVYSG